MEYLCQFSRNMNFFGKVFLLKALKAEYCSDILFSIPSLYYKACLIPIKYILNPNWENAAIFSKKLTGVYLKYLKYWVFKSKKHLDNSHLVSAFLENISKTLSQHVWPNLLFEITKILLFKNFLLILFLNPYNDFTLEI